MTYLERLAARVEEVGNSLCVGIDPDPAALPSGYTPDAGGIERFATLLVEAAIERAAAVKANLAFFEAFGSAGIAALERVRGRVPSNVPFIADAKRGDIGSTAARQAVALYDTLGADAVTASPYLGRDALAPLLDRPDRFVYVLCRTSNETAAEVQNLDVDGRPLYEQIAALTGQWACTHGNAGLVVGATAPDEITRIRATAPDLAFLVPGVGAQGGDIDAVRAHGPATAGAAGGARGGALLVNVSRAVAQPAVGSEAPESALRTEIARWAERLQC